MFYCLLLSSCAGGWQGWCVTTLQSRKSCLTALLTFCPALASDNSDSWMYHLNRPLQIVLCWCGWMKYTHLNQWAMPVLLVKLLLCFDSVSVHDEGKIFTQMRRIVEGFLQFCLSIWKRKTLPNYTFFWLLFTFSIDAGLAWLLNDHNGPNSQ